MKNDINKIQFLPIILLVLAILAYIIEGTDILVNGQASMFKNYFSSVLGMMMLSPITGIPVGIIGLKQGWNKILSIIDIVIGTIVMIVLLVLVVMFFMMLGAIARTH